MKFAIFSTALALAMAGWFVSVISSGSFEDSLEDREFHEYLAVVARDILDRRDDAASLYSRSYADEEMEQLDRRNKLIGTWRINLSYDFKNGTQTSSTEGFIHILGMGAHEFSDLKKRANNALKGAGINLANVTLTFTCPGIAEGCEEAKLSELDGKTVNVTVVNNLSATVEQPA